MISIIKPILIVLLFLTSATSFCIADQTLNLRSPQRPATPQQDDATLRDVCMVGPLQAWAAGDHGTLWKSADGGKTWSFVSLPIEHHKYTLQSLCFLTDRVGWVAGGTVLPGGTSQGVLLFTNDGGASWTAQNNTDLPLIRQVMFFDFDQGIAVTELSSRFPTGLLRTEDGGQNWTPINTEQSVRWRAASFQSLTEGIVVGEQGRLAAVRNEALIMAGSGTHGLRGMQAVSRSSSGQHWAVGDGAYLLTRDDRTGVWSTPESLPPRELQSFVNFRCVAQQNDHVWVSGSPGAVVWHSPDAGKSWVPQPTHDSVGLEAITFVGEKHGIAVGQLGRICRTEDGGATWTNVRGHSRRLACLNIPMTVSQTNIEFLTRWSREEGYRSAVFVAARRDIGPDAHAARNHAIELEQAVHLAGGSDARIDWRLPLSVPSLERHRERLTQEWTSLSDGRPEAMLGNLVATIRTWRPSVILLEEPASGDAGTDLIQQAVRTAVNQAADPFYYPEQIQLGGLRAWSVEKVILRRPSTLTGTASQNPVEVLPRLQTTLDVATSEAVKRFPSLNSRGEETFSYQIVSFGTQPASDRQTFWQNVSLGLDARRQLPPIQGDQFERLLSEAEHRRTIRSITRQYASRPDQGAQLLSQLGRMNQSLSDAQAAQQLADLAQVYMTNGEWGMVESVSIELVSRYPNEPPAAEALVWLIRFWGSAEMNWQRLRTMAATQSSTRQDVSVVQSDLQAQFDRSLEIVRNSATQTESTLELQKIAFQAQPEEQTLNTQIATGGGTASQRELVLKRWQQLATKAAVTLQDRHPHRFQEASTQFVAASLLRRHGNPAKADEIYATYLKTISGDPWHFAARGEAYLLWPGARSPKPVLSCRRTSTPPILDGLLSDDCWKSATEIRIGTPGSQETFVGTNPTAKGSVSSTGSQPIVFLSYDQNFLYIAASVPLHEGSSQELPQLPGRTHDSQLDDYDRISIQLDVDRDYATYYQFEVDQRGHTRDSCWNHAGFNPKWYVAAVRNNRSWNIECAIPLEELTEPGSLPGSVWAMGITRIIPGYDSQSWTPAGANEPNPPLFGLVSFE